MAASTAEDDLTSPENASATRRIGRQETNLDDENITQLSARGQQRSDDQHSIPSLTKRRGWVSRVLRVRDPVDAANQDPLLQVGRTEI